jgi:hypothetical protein
MWLSDRSLEEAVGRVFVMLCTKAYDLRIREPHSTHSHSTALTAVVSTTARRVQAAR